MATHGSTQRRRSGVYACFSVLVLHLLLTRCVLAEDNPNPADQKRTPTQTSGDQVSPVTINKTPAAPVISQNLTTSVISTSAAQDGPEKTQKPDVDEQPPTEKSTDTDKKPTEKSPPSDAETTNAPKTSTKTVPTTPNVPTTTVKPAKTTKPSDAPQPDVPPKTTHTSVLPSIDLTTEQNAIVTEVSDYDKEEDDDDEDDNYLSTESNNNHADKKPENKNLIDLTDNEDPEYNAEDQDSHFFVHLVILAFLVAIAYITYHNKRRILLLVQSRRWKDGLCSRNTVEYRRLDQNVNEAMPSLKMTSDYIF
ncbi:Keratinocyte-associated transmembrane protein 2 [Oryzias melastigma]|uniref:Keratinocyte-associated transmembrane protein 2 n=1 Tax=Oryzias melastigma TaxID=30732 RepID=A0A834C4B7_ORYME|nr:Keratinocyte-associated transmembrane protein 2 [Oryzias melastigma]